MVLIVLLCNCTRNKFYIIDDRFDINPSNTDSLLATGESIINFTSNIRNNNTSIGYSGSGDIQPFPKGYRAQIYVFTYDGELIDDPIYQSLTEGTLSPVSNPIIVATGSYHLYMTSLNNPDDPPQINDYEIYPVNNGNDYLWFHNYLSVSANNATIPINFSHSVAQIVLTVNNLDSIGLAEWINYTMIQVPDTTNIKWNLYTGMLLQEDSLTLQLIPSQELMTDKVTMNSSGLISTLCVLPVQTKDSIEAYVAIKLRDSSVNDGVVGFNIKLGIPDNELRAGTSYHYTFNISSDTVYIGDVLIDSWIAVDLEGNPLYPSIEEL